MPGYSINKRHHRQMVPKTVSSKWACTASAKNGVLPVFGSSSGRSTILIYVFVLDAATLFQSVPMRDDSASLAKMLYRHLPTLFELR
jgi:hypothetical protein